MEIEDEDTNVPSRTACYSCQKETTSVARWSPVLHKAQIVGYTCPACPRAGTSGEPIRRMVTKSAVVFVVTLDIGNDAAGRRRQEKRTFLTLALARAHVRTRGAEIKTARLAGRTVGGRDETIVNELCDRWLEARRGEIREVTRETYLHALKPVRRRIGNKRVQALTYADVLDLRNWLVREGGRGGQALGEHAAKSSLARLKSVLDHALHTEGIVSENVARAVKPPRAHRPEAETLERWTAEEVVRFIAHADANHLAAAWRLSCLGLRREEVLGLSWADVDFEAGTITVRQTRVAVSSSTDARRWMLGPPKSSASRRTIRPDSVHPGTMAALRRLKLASVADIKINPDRLVVVNQIGEPVKPKWFSDQFGALSRAAVVPQINLHSTRHTVAYLLHDANVPPVRAAAFLGHTLAVHLSVYLFAREDDVDLAGAALGEALRAVAAGS